jgi:hypothetical protein
VNCRGFWEATLVELFTSVPVSDKDGPLVYGLAIVKKVNAAAAAAAADPLFMG